MRGLDSEFRHVIILHLLHKTRRKKNFPGLLGKDFLSIKILWQIFEGLIVPLCKYKAIYRAAHGLEARRHVFFPIVI